MRYVKAQAEREATRGYGSIEKAVCPRHVDDAVLRQPIGDYATEMSCNYCDATFIAGELLIPDSAARKAAYAGWDNAQVAGTTR